MNNDINIYAFNLHKPHDLCALDRFKRALKRIPPITIYHIPLEKGHLINSRL